MRGCCGRDHPHSQTELPQPSPAGKTPGQETREPSASEHAAQEHGRRQEGGARNASRPTSARPIKMAPVTPAVLVSQYKQTENVVSRRMVGKKNAKESITQATSMIANDLMTLEPGLLRMRHLRGSG